MQLDQFHLLKSKQTQFCEYTELFDSQLDGNKTICFRSA